MARRQKAVPEQPTLLGAALRRGQLEGARTPLADRMRPRTLDEMVGQSALLGSDKMLSEMIRGDKVPSMILWGPPGSGKTTLAHVIAHATQSEFASAELKQPMQASSTKFVQFSAVLGGVAEVRGIVEAARERRAYQARSTILFVDEIHRFNKAQQDAFLPHVEDGTITLIGATTENPSFAVNSALLSRCKVFRLEALDETELRSVVEHALADRDRGFGSRELEIEPTALEAIARAARGDARRALNLLETAVELLPAGAHRIEISLVERASEERTLLYDKAGEEHYNVVSALIKSLRGSDPDAALYWAMRMLEAGDDPLFVLRRLIIFASEDVGNADPNALSVVVAADQAFRRIGVPEGYFPIAQACLYLATCPKSNAVKRALIASRSAVEEHGALPVPLKLRNAVTPLLREHGYGREYRYAPDYEGSYVSGETYLPDALVGRRFYEPGGEGFEKTIAEHLERLRRRT